MSGAGDIKGTNGAVAVVKNDFVALVNEDLVGQQVKHRLRTWLGESVYDRLAGMPYETVIFDGYITRDALELIVRDRLLAIDGVERVDSLEVTIDTAARTATIQGTVRASTGGEVLFSEVVS